MIRAVIECTYNNVRRAFFGNNFLFKHTVPRAKPSSACIVCIHVNDVPNKHTCGIKEKVKKKPGGKKKK